MEGEGKGRMGAGRGRREGRAGREALKGEQGLPGEREVVTAPCSLLSAGVARWEPRALLCPQECSGMGNQSLPGMRRPAPSFQREVSRQPGRGVEPLLPPGRDNPGS